MKARGSSIAKGDNKTAKIHENILNELLENPEELMIPDAAFITFEEEVGVEIAHENQDRRTKEIMGQKLEFEEALEPTDIIWENR